MSPSRRRTTWRRWKARASCAAPTSSSISSTRAFRPTTIFWPRLASRKRKALKKERREALSDGISIDWLTGSDLTEAVWDDFFAFYMDTGGRKWGRPYLNAEILLADRRADGRRRAAGDGEARRPLHRRRDQLHRLGHALRPQLGLHRGPPVPAFRGLLPSGDRLRDRPQAEGRRGRARKASTSWRAATGR